MQRKTKTAGLALAGVSVALAGAAIYLSGKESRQAAATLPASDAVRTTDKHPSTAGTGIISVKMPGTTVSGPVTGGSRDISLRPVAQRAKLLPRAPQPKAPLLQPEGEQLELSVKFHDNLRARALQGRLSLEAAAVPVELQSVVNQNAVQFAPVFAAAEAELTSLLARAEAKSGEAQADLHGLLFVTGTDTTPAGVFALAQAFDALPEVEYVRIEALDRRPKPPEDIAPVTASYLGNQQNYRRDAAGLFVDQAWGIYNARGQQMKFGDSEWAVDHTHEDLRTGATIFRINNLGGSPLPECVTGIPEGTPFDRFADHGTAVFSIVMGGDNGYGVTGISPDATGVFCSEWIAGGRAVSITKVLDNLDDGDVMLLEMQANGPYPETEFARDLAGAQGGNGPADLDQAVWDVVKAGTAAGMVVVVTAGNGNADLDRPAFDSYRARGDNGAILEGAAKSDTTHFKLGFSSHGSPLHLQGWGENVTAAGYGNLGNADGFANTNLQDCIVGRQTYTNTFNGTSSGGPIVSGPCVAVQSVAKAELGRPLTSREMRQLLMDTGTPQTFNSASTGLREAESLTYSSPSSDTISNVNGGGAVGSFIRLNANADNDTIVFSIPAVQRGSYKVKIREILAPDLGIYQLEVDDSDDGFSRLGGLVDQYAAGLSARISDIGTVSYNNTGLKKFRLKVTGKNAAAVQRNITVDSISLEATTAGGKVGTLPNVQKALEKLIGTPVPQSLDASGAYVETFNGWTLPTPESGWTILNGSGPSGPGKTSLVNGVLRMENPPGLSTNLATLHLNLAGKAGVVLGFDWHEQSDELHAMPAGAHVGVQPGDGLSMSTDGITWYPIFTFDAPDNNWRHANIPLDALLAARGLTYSDHFRLRFQHTDDGGYGSDGLELENVVVYTTAAASPMVLSPIHYGVTAAVGETPAPLNFVVVNKSTVPFNFTAAESLPWCSISTTSGTVGAGAAATITVTFNSGLAAGGYGGGIFITRGTETQDLWINLLVQSAPADTARTIVTAPSISTQPPGATAGPSELYPIPLNVSGLSGPVTDVNVFIQGLTHSYPNDLDLLLVGPQGQEVMLSSDAGGTVPVTNVSFTLDDAAASIVPSPPVNGATYRPTNVEGGGVDPMPGRPVRNVDYPTLLSAFNGTNPNGVWRLYINDDGNNDTGIIAGYQLNITTAGAGGLGLAEDFDGGADPVDLGGTTHTFTPDASPDGYAHSFAAAAALPTTHTGAAQTLTLVDDDSDLVASSRPFSFYGKSYTTFFVASNGHVTFAAANTDRSPDLATLHAVPRVAGLLTDLDPSSGGTVKAEEFADRMVITFSAVRQFSSASTNTFQMEFFLDTGVIRLSYGTVQTQGGVAGLSRGMGSTGFVETNLVPSRAPYSGTPSAIPGKIEPEHYDLGYPFPWSDSDPANVGGAFRSDPVDLETAGDTGGGFNIGWINSGEWVEYTVNVASAGNYTLYSRVASSGGGGSFRLDFNGVDKTGAIAVPNTGGFQAWGTLVRTQIALSAGVQTMRIHFLSPGLNLNHLTFFKEEAGSDPGLVARWKLDENGAVSVADSAGEHHGLLAGGLQSTAWRPTGGMIGGALAYPVAPQQWVAVPSDDVVKLRSLNGQYSVSAWVKLTSAAHQMIACQGLGCSSWASWYLGVGGSENLTAPGKFTCGIRTSDSGASTEIASTQPAITGQWTHLCFTCDGTTLRFYVNGQAAGSIAAGLPYASPELSFYLGADPGCGGRTSLQGLLDDVRIYATALAPATVLARAYGPLPAGGDLDQDGQINSTEIAWGLDPFNSASLLRVEIGRQGAASTVSFPFQAGRTYNLQYSPNLITWTTIYTHSPVSGPGTFRFVESNAGRIAAPRGYYRLSPP